MTLSALATALAILLLLLVHAHVVMPQHHGKLSEQWASALPAWLPAPLPLLPLQQRQPQLQLQPQPPLVRQRGSEELLALAVLLELQAGRC